jgi:urea transport system permease protein
MLRSLVLCLTLIAGPAAAQGGPSGIQELLREQGDLIAESSRRTIGPAIDALAASGLPEAREVLERWQERELYLEEGTGRFVFGEEIDRSTLRLTEIASGEPIGVASDDGWEELRPNAGIRGLIAAALVRFQLTDPDPAIRREALDAIARNPEESHLGALREAIPEEELPSLRARAARLERLLTIQFGETVEARVEAIASFSGDLDLDVRGALNPLLATELTVAEGEAEGEDVARILRPGTEALSRTDAYELLVREGLAPKRLTREAKRSTLVSNLENGSVGGYAVAQLDTEGARNDAYQRLVEAGRAEPAMPEEEIDEILARYSFAERYVGAPTPVALAAERVLTGIGTRVGLMRLADLSLDGLSLASIYFLAAIGLAITFGVMGVINMAHGEFIMMGAYTAYVVQQFVPDYTLSLVLALPLAFAVTFAAGVVLERLVIRHLYHRPLETLLATFGISIALQQLAKNVFGTQARPLTAPAWLDGSFVFNDIVAISYIRIAIFGLALVFLALFLFIMRRTRLGLEVRAVTQNRRMAGAMGINPGRINMLTFGLGSGIAGIAGVAIGLYAQVTSEMGQSYIVQSFMTVVVGGVGNIWGTLLGATLVGFLQKGIEWLNPSNTLAAQTYMILFIILFIQFRPRGIVALKGRAAEA